MQCPQCAVENAAGAIECAACGEELVRVATVLKNQPRGSRDAAPMLGEKAHSVMNTRPMDNLIQGLSILFSMVLGSVIGGLIWGGPGLMLGFLGGLIGGLIISGAVLAVIGLIRKP